jgi:uncharacterized protein YbcI
MPHDPSTSTDSPAKAISRGTVAIYKEYLGRGPAGAHTTITDEFVTVVLEKGLTRAEQHLVASGEHEAVRSIRRKFQTAMASDIRHLVEAVTGRQSASLLSDHDVDIDIAVETVVFEKS